ncbi:hypothetical protein, partial [Pseudomonas viridiflava]|uniref:hypothetical protein n=1 Tax=Pseudomonas viridiflava TaxID=33069 RepID=UPI001980EE70
GANVLPVLILNDKKVLIHTDDVTVPNMVINQSDKILKGALTVTNSSLKDLENLTFNTILNGAVRKVAIPRIPKLSMRKVIFEFDTHGIIKPGNYNLALQL